MAIRRSTKLINKLAGGYGVRDLLRDGRIYIYSGSQPDSGDSAPSGTALMTFTSGGNTYVDATKATATIAIGGAAVGAITSVTVGGMAFNLLSEEVAFTTSAESTALLIAASINAKDNPLNIVAEASTSNVVLSLPHWIGAEANGLAFATSTSGSLTATANGVFSGGITAMHGINFGETITNGSISKDAETWQAQGIFSGTAGWFRYVPAGSTVDGVADEDVRFDGSVGTSNADLIISSTSIVTGAVHTISTATITEASE